MPKHPGSQGPEGILSPFSVPGYWRLFAGHANCWGFAAIEWMATGWLVLELTGSPFHVALIDFYRFAPWLLVGLVSGPLIQRFGRKPIVLACQVSYIGSYGALALLVLTGQPAYWQIALIAAVGTGTMALDFTTRRTMLPSMIGRDRIVDAMLLDTLVQSVSFTAGPFVGGWLIEVIGIGNLYALVAVAPLLGLILYAHLPNLPSPAPAQESTVRRILLGLRYVRGNRVIVGILLITVAMNVLTFSSTSLMPVFARDILGQGPMGLGMLSAATGLGALLGMPLVNLMRRRLNNNFVFAASSVLMSTLLVIFAFSTDFSFSLAVLIIAGIGQAGFSALQSSVVLIEASDEMRDRAMGTVLLAIGTGPFGRLILGTMAAAWGAPMAVALCCGGAVLAIVTLTLAIPEYGRWRRGLND
jgi:MFS family permease